MGYLVDQTLDGHWMNTTFHIVGYIYNEQRAGRIQLNYAGERLSGVPSTTAENASKIGPSEPPV